MKNYNILIVDDEKSQRDILRGYLMKKGYEVYCAESGNQAINIINHNLIDIILSDYKMPGMSGMTILEKAVKINPEISMVMITAYGSIENAVSAMHLGAYDYLTKPVNLEELNLLITRIIEHKNLKSENQLLKKQLCEKYELSSFISHSPSMENVLSVAMRAADSNATILITGENGTGKEVLARSIHCISRRKENPFVTVNIPALPESLLESELFGHEKSAFTGAEKMKIGRFELADKATIFLDEIGDIPLSVQVKLLRVLQEHQFERVGGTKSIKVDVRIIAATNHNLEKRIREKIFREDLYYRLNIVGINIPPLRERKEDILPLIEFFIKKYSQENGRHDIEMSKEAVDVLMKYNYPGNVRELENIVERSVVLARTNILTTNDLPPHLRGENKLEDFFQRESGKLNKQVELLEKKLIFDALKESGGNQTKAGNLLGLTERNLRYKLKKYNIKH
jgi:two-component system NtrC family response regulator